MYPWHTRISSTSFWVGEHVSGCIAVDCSQDVSTYDSQWKAHYGGCDGVVTGGACQTEKRTAANGYFPLHMSPLENPFYLDLPYDDVNDSVGFAERCQVIPWAKQIDPTGAHCSDGNFSYMKNRWVEIIGPNGHTCYGQIEDAGPRADNKYRDANYVFSSTDARPNEQHWQNAGDDVSPALNGCLGFAALDGTGDLISWRFVDDADVPPGPWTRIVTHSGVTP